MKKLNLCTLFLLITLITTAQNQQVKKYVTIELMTNTFCILCANFDPPAIDTYEANAADVHLITVHPNVPYSACPFFNANSTDNLARRTMYGSFTSTPRTFTNGLIEKRSANLITQDLIDDNAGQFSPLRVEVIETGPPTDRIVTVNVKSFDTPPTGDLNLYVANVLKYVDFDAVNGLQLHHNVLWQFLTSETGDPITLADIDGTVSKTFSYNTDNLTHPSFEADQVYTIAFIQNNNTREIFNSGSSKNIIIDANITDATSGNSNGAIDLNIRGGSGNYSIFWAQGATTSSVNNLAAGTYAVTVTDSEGASVSNQFVVSSQLSSSSVNLNSGWNLVSFSVSPVDKSIPNIFSSLQPGNLRNVTTFDSGTLTFNPTVPPFLNTLTKVADGYGYWIEVENADLLTIQGNELDDNFRKPLNSGWNLIAYIPDAPQNPRDYFADLISNGELEFVSGFDNGVKVFDPNAPIFLNTLIQLENGKGYWVKIVDPVNKKSTKHNQGF